jgi:acetyl esterase/lipase
MPFIASCLFALATLQSDKPVIPLWPNGAPGSEGRQNEPETKPNPWSIGHIYNPSLTVYQPEPGKSNGHAIIVAPGGGFRELVVGEEGYKPAAFFAQLGFTAFVLKYRLVREAGSNLTLDKDARADAVRSVRLARSLASKYGFSADKVGMIGFSAGGETLSYAAFSDKAENSSATDPIDKLSSRPNFAIWIYPGPVGVPESVPADAPPAFFLVAQDDGASRVVLDLVGKYRAVKAPYEVHILSGGGHGFNMGERSKLVAVKDWRNRLSDWFKDRGFIKP